MIMEDTTRRFELQDGAGGLVTIEGQLIGSGSSLSPTKLRWFEVDIYVLREGGFAVHTRGMSKMPSEKTLTRLRRVGSAVRAIQCLIVHHNEKTYLPNPSIDAIEQAMTLNEEMRQAYRALPESLFD